MLANQKYITLLTSAQFLKRLCLIPHIPVSHLHSSHWMRYILAEHLEERF